MGAEPPYLIAQHCCEHQKIEVGRTEFSNPPNMNSLFSFLIVEMYKTARRNLKYETVWVRMHVSEESRIMTS